MQLGQFDTKQNEKERKIPFVSRMAFALRFVVCWVRAFVAVTLCVMFAPCTVLSLFVDRKWIAIQRWRRRRRQRLTATNRIEFRGFHIRKSRQV